MFSSSRALVRLLRRTQVSGAAASTHLVGSWPSAPKLSNVSIIISRSNHAIISPATTVTGNISDANGPSSSAATPGVNIQPVVDKLGRSYGTGRRKSSVARVWIKEGSGQFVVNDSRLLDYFQPIQREHILGSFLASGTAGLFDVWCSVKGGGISGQAGAIRLGISRALEAFDPQLRPCLSRAGMLTRDSRRVERKKPGQKKARKKFQWVKR